MDEESLAQRAREADVSQHPERSFSTALISLAGMAFYSSAWGLGSWITSHPSGIIAAGVLLALGGTLFGAQAVMALRLGTAGRHALEWIDSAGQIHTSPALENYPFIKAMVRWHARLVHAASLRIRDVRRRARISRWEDFFLGPLDVIAVFFSSMGYVSSTIQSARQNNLLYNA